jgi:hypothetical protein
MSCGNEKDFYVYYQNTIVMLEKKSINSNWKRSEEWNDLLKVVFIVDN